MTDTNNTDVPPASPTPEPAAPAAVARPRSGWVTPFIASLVVAVTLVVGGVGGFALATATHAGGRPAIDLVSAPGQHNLPHGGPAQPGPQLGGPHQGGTEQNPEGPHGPRPELPSDDANESPEEDESSTEDPSTQG